MFCLQTLTSAMLLARFVTSTPTVRILWGPTAVHVKLVLLEMGKRAQPVRSLSTPGERKRGAYYFFLRSLTERLGGGGGEMVSVEG